MSDHAHILTQLTPEQQQCLLDLTPEWSDQGFSVIQAALLWATDTKFFPDRPPPLVEYRIIRKGIHVYYQYKLNDLGVIIQSHLRGDKV